MYLFDAHARNTGVWKVSILPDSMDGGRAIQSTEIYG